LRRARTLVVTDFLARSEQKDGDIKKELAFAGFEIRSHDLKEKTKEPTSAANSGS
jgi:hypothetical protein